MRSYDLTDAGQVRRAFAERGYVEGFSVAAEPAAAEAFTAVLEIAAADARSPRRSKGVHATHEAILRLAQSPSVLRVVQAVLGPQVQLWGSTVFCKWPADRRTVAWHQDAAAWPLWPHTSVTVWIALDRTDQENGALSVVPGSHTGPLRSHVTGRNTGTDQGNLLDGALGLADPDPLTGSSHTLELLPGEFSVHTSTLVHGSGPNVSAQRRCALALRYSPPQVRPVEGERWPGFAAIAMPPVPWEPTG